jgi:DNA-binding IclR family transcriptional regulator
MQLFCFIWNEGAAMKLKSVDKAISILDCLSIQGPILGVGDISAITGYAKSTVSRLLSTLAQRGCVEKAQGFGKYRLGYRIHLWGNSIKNQMNLATISLPVMKRLRDECNEEVGIYVVEGLRRLCIQRVGSLHEIEKVSRVGAYYPLHAGAAGKLLLAFLPKDKQEAFFSSNSLEKLTDKTITDLDTLKKDLQLIRKRGYAVSRGERELGAFSVNAPVRDSRGSVIADLSVSGPLFRLTDNKLESYIHGVLSAAKEISERLGHVEDT